MTQGTQTGAVYWTEDPGRLQSRGRKESDMTEQPSLLTFIITQEDHDHFLILLKIIIIIIISIQATLPRNSRVMCVCFSFLQIKKQSNYAGQI